MIRVDIPIIGDVGHVLEDILKIWKSRGRKTDKEGLQGWWTKIEEWKKIDCLSFKQTGSVIKPQYALHRLEELTRDHDRYICTEVGQHQMWGGPVSHFQRSQSLDDLRRPWHDGLWPARLCRGADGPTPRRW